MSVHFQYISSIHFDFKNLYYVCTTDKVGIIDYGIDQLSVRVRNGGFKNE